MDYNQAQYYPPPPQGAHAMGYMGKAYGVGPTGFQSGRVDPYYIPAPSAGHKYVPPTYNPTAATGGYDPGLGGRGPPPVDHSEKFSKGNRFNDFWAAILYLIDLGAFIALAVIGIRNYAVTPKSGAPLYTSPTQPGYGGYPSKATGTPTFDEQAIIMFLFVALVGFVLTVIYFIYANRFPRQFIKTTFALSIIVYFGIVIFYFVYQYWSAAVIFLVFAILYACCWFWWQDRIAFASVMLETVTSIIKRHPGTVAIGIAALLLQTAFSVLWTFTVVGCYQVYYEGSQGSNAKLNIIMIFLVFTYYWTTQVIAYTIHTTIAGVFATYYFLSGTGQEPKNTTCASLKRATTTSFGSICYGALLIAAFNLFRYFLSMAQQQTDNPICAFILCCVQCCAIQIQALMEYFNYYAYTQVAIYGKDFCTAARDTWTIIKDRGIEALINDNLTGNVIFIGSLLIGMITALVGYVYLVITRPAYNSTGDMTVIVVFLSFIIGTSMFYTVGTVIQSGVATTFVCLAEDPTALQRTKPELFERIRQTWPRVVQGV
ncbi:hypothetical protein BZG36_05241 [Bifiguratus adelaidae]|uniref:Protein PNS1 n=1 Tax=Bifiguratus adelaidae TaxID=1938954 RepID=A0A261XUX3_9FUNG|nr:hypothetical protein BZG36_05241 [Bifiguratus adelaidae]